MKKHKIMALLALGWALNGAAQQNLTNKNGGQEQHKELSADERAKKSANKAAERLGLSADQKIKWEAAKKEHALANLPLKEKMEGSTTPEERKQLKKQIRSNHDNFESSVKTFLTAEQFTTFQDLKKDRQKTGERHKRQGS